MCHSDLLALDFDGVICDSAGEMAQSAWLAAAEFWPERFPDTAPADFIAAFHAARPVIETGYQSILLAGMLQEGTPNSRIQEAFPALCKKRIRRDKLSLDDLKHRFGRARDRWIASDRESWIAAHDYYEGVIPAVNAAAAEVCIITTKQERFARELASAGGLQVAPEMIFGLERGAKEGVLRELCATHARIHFVEDRLRTLERVRAAAVPVELYLVDWGYNTPAERKHAAEQPDVSLLTIDDFRDLVRSPADFKSG